LEIDCAHRLAVHPDRFPERLVVEALSCEGVGDGRLRTSDSSLAPLVEQREHTTINKRAVRRLYSEILQPGPDSVEEAWFVTSASWRWSLSRTRFRPLFFCLKVCFRAAIEGCQPAWFVEITKQTKPFVAVPRQTDSDLWVSLGNGGRHAWVTPRPSRYELLLSDEA
jgi:hypothetical protein